MPNRTIYLPEELDEVSRRLGLNLSRLTQAAINEHIQRNRDESIDALVEASSARTRRLGVTWPSDALEQQRREAGER
ncbi:MAG: hypothetical protein GXP35_04530 [Actinobacteria bacterium]|nr:hypothetical protein [Actinomycetota bacterium]